MAYLGNDLKVAYPTYVNIDDISGSFNGSTTSFALLVRGAAPVPLPLNSQQCLISVAGVLQRPDDTGAEGFRLSGGNIVFSSAPATGADFFGVILAGADYVNAGATYPDGSAAVPSITFDQDTDTGFYRSGSGVVSFSSNSVQTAILATTSLTAPSFIPTSSTVPTNGVYLPSANNVAISTNGTGRLFVNSSGNVGIGDTAPSYKLTSSVSSTNTSIPSITNDNITVAGVNTGAATANQLVPMLFRFADGTYNGNSVITALRESATGRQQSLVFAPSNSSGDPNERARIDSSGRLLVGTSSTSASFSALLQNASGDSFGILGLAANTATPADNSPLGDIRWSDSSHTLAAMIRCKRDAGTWSGSSKPTRLEFSTTADGASSPTERMRIASNGITRISNNGSYAYAGTVHEVNSDFNSVGFAAISSNANFTDAVLQAAANRNTSNSTYNLFKCSRIGIADVFIVRDSGNALNTNNSYTGISDIKLKENIVDANSQWDDIKALRVRNYNFKEVQTHRQIGLIAQEVEPVCPGLVDEAVDRDTEGNDLGTTTKSVNYSVLYMKAVKALQEAMERIEQLETEMAEVKAQLQAS